MNEREDFSHDSENIVVELDEEDALEFSGNFDLKVKKTDFAMRIQLFNEQIKEKVYPNFSSPKGLVVIINNKNFNTSSTRNGTEYDEQKLLQMFLAFGYAVIAKHDLSGKEMLDFAKSVGNNEANKSYDSFIVVVLTHGKKDILCGSDEEHVDIYKFLECFHSNNAPFLNGKPKLFFIQACRGNFRDLGTVIQSMDAQNSSENNTEKHPTDADMLIAYATSTNKFSYRNRYRGSWFIQSVCKIFSEFAATEDICSLLTQVNRRVAHLYKGQSGEKQMPSSVNQLTKKFYFFPGDDNLFAFQQGPDEVVSQRTMKSDVIIKQNGEVQIDTLLVANHWSLGFRGAAKVYAYDIKGDIVWECQWRNFGVNLYKQKTRKWNEQIPPGILRKIHTASILHRHISEISSD